MAKASMKIWSENVRLDEESAGIEEVLSRLGPNFFRKFRKEMQLLMVVDDFEVTIEMRKPETEERTCFRLKHVYKPAHANLGTRRTKTILT